MDFRIFISYSHVDSALVEPVVRMLRAARDSVFRDVDSIKPGKPWRMQIAKALQRANLVYVFWCLRARGSKEVSDERTMVGSWCSSTSRISCPVSRGERKSGRQSRPVKRCLSAGAPLSDSKEVTWEYKLAFMFGKHIMPLLLDDTPLPSRFMALM